MTNTSDFRRYTYGMNYTARDDVRAFGQSNSSTAPKFAPDVNPDVVLPTPRRKLSVNTNDRLKSHTQLLQEQKLAAKQVTAVIVVFVLTIAMLSTALFTYVLKNEYTREIANLKIELDREINQSRCTNAKLESLVTIDLIEDYAVNNLGMVKLKSDQVKYIDVEQYKNECEEALELQSQSVAADIGASADN